MLQSSLLLPLAAPKKIHLSSSRILLIQISSNSTKTGKVKFQHLLRKPSKRVGAHKELRRVRRRASNKYQRKTLNLKLLRKSKKRLKKLELQRRQRQRSEWCTYKVNGLHCTAC